MTMRGLLDTSAVIELYHPAVRAAMPDEVAISAVTAAELAAGPLRAGNPVEAAAGAAARGRGEVRADPVRRGRRPQLRTCRRGSDG